jgi:hypothetical protein
MYLTLAFDFREQGFLRSNLNFSDPGGPRRRRRMTALGQSRPSLVPRAWAVLRLKAEIQTETPP